jgi:hypothetical protein
MPGPREILQEFKQARGNRRDAHVFPPMNRGTLYCFVGIPLPESALLRADLPAEEYPETPGAAKVERKSWSPNEIVLDVDAASPTRILVNQNYNPHWTTDVGAVVSVDKLLGIEVPQGKHTVTLRYKDGLSSFCFFLSSGALLAMLLYIARKRAQWLRVEAVRWKEMGAFWFGAKLEPEEKKEEDEPKKEAAPEKDETQEKQKHEEKEEELEKKDEEKPTGDAKEEEEDEEDDG